MPKAYKILFNAITDCIRILIAAQPSVFSLYGSASHIANRQPTQS